MQFVHGAVQWLAADPATTVYSVTGLGRRPAAVKVYWQGLGSATDLVSDTTHARLGHGFAVSASARRCVTFEDQDAVTTMVCTTAMFTDCIAATVTATGPARDGALDIDFNEDGFDLIVDDQAPVDITVFYEVIFGPDVTVAVVGDITEPAATGNQDYSVPGFDTAGLGDQVVFFAGIQNIAADTVTRNNAGICAGCATSGDSAQNVVASTKTTDNIVSSNGSRYGLAGECLALITSLGVVGRATLTQFNTDGFRLNWLARDTTDRRYIFLAIKGGLWQAGSLTVRTLNVGDNTVVTGLPFTPRAVSGASVGTVINTAGTAHSNGSTLICGTSTSSSSRRGMSYAPEHLVANAAIMLSLQYDLYAPHSAFSVAEAFSQDITAFSDDGFTQTWIGPDSFGDSQGWSWYVATGNRKFILH